jgi:hypothetical protein
MVFYTYKDNSTSLRVLEDGEKDITLEAPYCPINGKFCQGECYTGCTSQGQFMCDPLEGAYCLCNVGIDDCSLPIT